MTARLRLGCLSLALLAACAALLLAGCSGGSDAARARASQLARAAGFRPLIIDAPPFHLLAFVRLSGPAAVLRVYIEGDGHAWDTMAKPSDDPTPWSPVALELAAADPAPAVAYLARPCQYVPPGTDAACTEHAWTDARYSPAVIASTAVALNRLKVLAGAAQLSLVGFSGGGAVAVLAAAQRSDLCAIRTVAANLDTALWTEEHHVTPLIHSLDPVTVAPLLAKVPQIHFVGAADPIVSAAVIRAYAAASGPAVCLGVIVVPGMAHDGDWPAIWPALLARPWPARCRREHTAALR